MKHKSFHTNKETTRWCWELRFVKKRLYLQWNILGKNKSFQTIKTTRCCWSYRFAEKVIFSMEHFIKEKNHFPLTMRHEFLKGIHVWFHVT